MKKFRIHLEHDAGTVRISTVTDDIKKAIEAVLNAEGAPFSAVYRIDVINL